MADQNAEQASEAAPDNVDVSVGAGMQLTEEMIYAPDSAPPAEPEAAPAEPAGEAAPAGEPKAEAAPEAAAEAAPAAAPGEAPAEEPAAVAAPWDPERQTADQQMANLRKTNEDLMEQLEAAHGAGEAPADATATMAEIDTELESIGKEIEELDDFDDAIVLKGLLTKQNGLMRKQAGLQRQLSSDAMLASEAVQATADKAAYDAIINGVCQEVGEEHRNDILKGMIEVWKERGYDATTSVPPGQVKDAAFAIGRKLALAKRPAGKKAPAGPAASPGTGGAPVAPKLPSGETLEETIANMTKEKKFQQ